MSTNSAIQWTQATWNPISGCTRVSAGCDNCYAVTMTHRLANMGQDKYSGLTVLNKAGDRHFNGVVRTVPESLDIPIRRRKPTVYFVNSMSDLFHKDVPFEFIDRVFAVMALCPQHTFQILTKRPERMAEYFGAGVGGRISNAVTRLRLPSHLSHVGVGTGKTEYINGALCGVTGGKARRNWPLPNVWLGTSIENQATADERSEHLRRCPAAVRWYSCEPLLSAIDRLPLDGISWVVCGGESGHGARPCDIGWIRSIVQQCKAAGVAVFVKQLGANPVGCGGSAERDMPLRDRKGGDMSEFPSDLRVREFPTGLPFVPPESRR